MKDQLVGFRQAVHDGLGQQVTCIQLLSEALAKGLSTREHPKAGTAALVLSFANKAQQDVRDLLREMPVVSERTLEADPMLVSGDGTGHIHATDPASEISTLEEQLAGFRQQIHDRLGQQLTGIRMLTEMLVSSLTRDGHASVATASLLLQFARNAQKDAVALHNGIIPEPDLSSGLPSALSVLLRDTCESTGTESCFIFEGVDRGETVDVTGQLFRIAQEAIHNAIRHGRAGRISVSLSTDDEGHVLRIEDDGVGFDMSKDHSVGIGLTGMQRRATSLGGDLKVTSTVGAGTIVECRLNPKRRAAQPRRRRGPSKRSKNAPE